MLDDAATAAGTIGYELLSAITARVPRVYVG
jgi:alanine racemase